jgi:ssDNA-binding Zn-finger/Zn-ribbon topoisomerase 1
MPPTKTDTGHGSLFDLFPDRPQSLHGGARFDEGFNLQAKDAPKGRNFDEWGKPSRDVASHGPVWDEFGWKDMPESHGGLLFDEGFDSPSANQTSRGPLYDLFEPSTQVKFIYDGQDAEGIVDHVREDGIVMVTPRAGGDAVEVGVEQFLAYKSPSVDNATTIAPESDAESPSARDATAHGAGILAGEGTGAGAEPGTPVQAVAPGPGNPDARTEIPEDWSTVDHLKSILEGDDVGKGGDFAARANAHAQQHGTGAAYSRRMESSTNRMFTMRRGKQVGMSIQPIGEKTVRGYHQPDAATQHPLGAFPSHDTAHRAIVAAHEKHLGKSSGDLLDVQKTVGYHMHLKDGFATHTLNDKTGERRIGTSRSLGGAEGGVMAHHKQGNTLMHIGTFPSHEAAHTAILGAHSAWTAKNVESPLDVLKESLGVEKSTGAEISGSAPGYRMTAGPNKSAVDHWDKRSGRRIGSSVATHPGHVVAGYHYENGEVHTLGHHDTHSAAHARIVGFHQDLAETSARIRQGAHKTAVLPSQLLKSHSEWGGVAGSMTRMGVVAKDVTVAETAIQAEEGAATLAGAKGAGSYCPECRATKKSLTEDGRCPDCNTVLKAHEPGRVPREKGDGNGSSEDSSGNGVGEKTFGSIDDLRKAFGAPADAYPGGQTVTTDGSVHQRGQQTGQATSDPGDVEIEEREHKDSDHHSDMSGVPTTCPHCGQVIAELDAKTDEGAPANASPTVGSGSAYNPSAHKCVEMLAGVTVAKDAAGKSCPGGKKPLQADDHGVTTCINSKCGYYSPGVHATGKTDDSPLDTLKQLVAA